MSKPRFRLYAEVDTLAHANTIKNSITNELAGKDIFEEHGFGVRQGDILNPNKIIVYAEWRFNTAIDRDEIREWLKDQIQNHPQVKNWVSVARLSWHRCTHDEEIVKDCRTTNYAEWNK